jgi:hypothetical protein
MLLGLRLGEAPASWPPPPARAVPLVRRLLGRSEADVA